MNSEVCYIADTILSSYKATSVHTRYMFIHGIYLYFLKTNPAMLKCPTVQYQDYIDQMSDEEDLNISDQYQSDDYESELEDSFESLEHDDENTEFVELDDSFTE